MKQFFNFLYLTKIIAGIKNYFHFCLCFITIRFLVSGIVRVDIYFLQILVKCVLGLKRGPPSLVRAIGYLIEK